jgi:post-segregation antitoxin (ccd killing protein)
MLVRRKMTTIRIKPELIRKAHDMGLNVSKVSENALKEAIRRLEDINFENGCQNGADYGQERGSWCGGWDLNFKFSSLPVLWSDILHHFSLLIIKTNKEILPNKI